MLLFKYYHGSVATIFPLILLLSGAEVAPHNGSDKVDGEDASATGSNTYQLNIFAYSRYCLVLVIFGLIYMNEILIEGWEPLASAAPKPALRAYYARASRYTLSVLLAYFIFNLSVYLPDFLSIALYLVSMLLLISLGLFFKISFNRHGFTEVVYCLFQCPNVLLMSHLVLTGEFSISPAIKFSPFNLTYLLVSITEHARSDDSTVRAAPPTSAREHANTDFARAIAASRSPEISAYNLLGKTDCFRMMILIVAYIVFYGVTQSYHVKMFSPLLPSILFFNLFVGIVSTFQKSEYAKCKRDMRKTYFLFSIVYILCNSVLVSVF